MKGMKEPYEEHQDGGENAWQPLEEILESPFSVNQHLH